MVESRYYDYGTSPRKTDPIPQRRTTTKRSNPNVKKELTKKPSNSSKSKASKKKELELRKQKIKMILYLVAFFSVLFTISYRYSLIDKEFNNLAEAKGQLTLLQKENDKIKLNIENMVNLNNIERIAIEKLGMQKLDKSQIIYIELDNKDYVEKEIPSIMEKEENIFEKIKKGIFNGF